MMLKVMQKKTYIVFVKSEGQDVPLAVTNEYEAAQLFINNRVAALNSRYINGTNSNDGLRYEFDPYTHKRHSIKEINIVAPNGCPQRVWFVRIDFYNGKALISRYSREEDHVTYFAEGVGDIPICTFKFPYSDGNGAHIFSKVSLSDAIEKAKAYLKGLGRSYSYRNTCL